MNEDGDGLFAQLLKSTEMPETDHDVTWTNIAADDPVRHAVIYEERHRRWWQFWKPKTWTVPLWSGPYTEIRPDEN